MKATESQRKNRPWTPSKGARNGVLEPPAWSIRPREKQFPRRQFFPLSVSSVACDNAPFWGARVQISRTTSERTLKSCCFRQCPIAVQLLQFSLHTHRVQRIANVLSKVPNFEHSARRVCRSRYAILISFSAMFSRFFFEERMNGPGSAAALQQCWMEKS